MATLDDVLVGAGNPRAAEEVRFLAKFWADPELEREFSRSYFFGADETERIRELLAGDETYYLAYKTANLARIEEVAAFVAERVPAGSRVLDVGCGMGQLAHALARRGHSVTGIDINRVGIEMGRAILGELGSSVEIGIGDALAIPRGDASVDAVVSCDVIEHLPEQGRFLRELLRVLRPGGTAFIHTDNDVRVRIGVGLRRLSGLLRGRRPGAWRHAWAGLEGGHCALTTPRRLRSIALESGFERASLRMCGASLLPGLLAPKFILVARAPAGPVDRD